MSLGRRSRAINADYVVAACAEHVSRPSLRAAALSEARLSPLKRLLRHLPSRRPHVGSARAAATRSRSTPFGTPTASISVGAPSSACSRLAEERLFAARASKTADRRRSPERVACLLRDRRHHTRLERHGESAKVSYRPPCRAVLRASPTSTSSRGDASAQVCEGRAEVCGVVTATRRACADDAGSSSGSSSGSASEALFVHLIAARRVAAQALHVSPAPRGAPPGAGLLDAPGATPPTPPPRVATYRVSG